MFKFLLCSHSHSHSLSHTQIQKNGMFTSVECEILYNLSRSRSLSLWLLMRIYDGLSCPYAETKRQFNCSFMRNSTIVFGTCKNNRNTKYNVFICRRHLFHFHFHFHLNIFLVPVFWKHNHKVKNIQWFSKRKWLLWNPSHKLVLMLVLQKTLIFPFFLFCAKPEEKKTRGNMKMNMSDVYLSLCQ